MRTNLLFGILMLYSSCGTGQTDPLEKNCREFVYQLIRYYADPEAGAEVMKEVVVDSLVAYYDLSKERRKIMGMNRYSKLELYMNHVEMTDSGAFCYIHTLEPDSLWVPWEMLNYEGVWKVYKPYGAASYLELNQRQQHLIDSVVDLKKSITEASVQFIHGFQELQNTGNAELLRKYTTPVFGEVLYLNWVSDTLKSYYRKRSIDTAFVEEFYFMNDTSLRARVKIQESRSASFHLVKADGQWLVAGEMEVAGEEDLKNANQRLLETRLTIQFQNKINQLLNGLKQAIVRNDFALLQSLVTPVMFDFSTRILNKAVYYNKKGIYLRELEPITKLPFFPPRLTFSGDTVLCEYSSKMLFFAPHESDYVLAGFGEFDGANYAGSAMIEKSMLAFMNLLYLEYNPYHNNTIPEEDPWADGGTKVEFVMEEYYEQEDTTVYSLFDVLEVPVFDGGIEMMYSFISEHLKYPKADKDSGVSGIVVVSFVVEKNGELNWVQAISGPSESLKTEAVRLVKSMPKWICAKGKMKESLRCGHAIEVPF